jgi:putative transposase
MERIPATERTRDKLKALMEGRSEIADGRSELVRLAARLIIEEALEGEARDALGRDYYARGAMPGAGYRNGYRTGRVKSAEGAIEYSTPQIADRREPFRSRLREVVRGRTEELEALAVEMYARGLSTRDIEAVFADGHGRSLLSRSAVSEITERLWTEYEAFASRDLSEFAVTYLFVDGIAERLHLGQPREAVLAAWGILGDGKGAVAPGAGDQGGHDELQGVLPGHAAARPARPAAGGERRGARHDPRDRGMLAALGSPALPGAQDAKPAKQDPGRRLARVQGP